MFFKKPYVHARDLKRPKVIALYSDNFIGEIRIKPYLNALLARGVIADYQVADRAMKLIDSTKRYEFTHIWCQRNVSTAQYGFLKQNRDAPIIYDLDDLLTSVPPFVMRTRRRTLDRIGWCLQHAKAITVATERLAGSLREDARVPISEMIVLKNGCASVPVPARANARKQLIWTSGDVPFFLREFPEFTVDLAKLANRAGYEVILVGRFDVKLNGLFDRWRYIRFLDFVSYREFLRTFTGALAIAPLPSRLPAQAQRFFNAKSDIKLVDYLQSGLVPICSRAVPYETSNLYLPLLAAADADEILQRLDAIISDYDRTIEYIDEMIHVPGLLKQREFSVLSNALDHLFV